MSAAAWSRLLDTLPASRRKLERRVLDALGAAFAAWHAQRVRTGSLAGERDAALPLADFLTERIAAAQSQIDSLNLCHARFVRDLGLAANEDARRRMLLDHARALGADEAQLAGDEAALARWFGADALGDRVAIRSSTHEREITIALDLLGRQAGALLAAAGPDSARRLWERLAIEATTRALFAFEGHARVRFAAFLCLTEALAGLPPAEREGAVQPGTLQFIYRCAQDARQYLWLQTAAIELLRELAPAAFLDVVRLRLTRPHAGDDLFVRRRAVLLAAASIPALPEAAQLLPLALADTSAYVRQGLAQALENTPSRIAEACLPTLLADAVAQVRAQALLTLPALPAARNLPSLVWLLERLEREDDSFVLRTALHVTERFIAQAVEACPHGPHFAGQDGRAAELARVEDAVRHLHTRAPDLRVRRWAAETMQRFALLADPELRALVDALAPLVAHCAPGRSLRLPAQFDTASSEQLGRAAMLLARRDFPLDLERRFGHWHLQRGHRFGFRLWRWLHEYRHSSPDKRQAFRHTIGRIFRGGVHAPSQILAELAQTKVPGEPLQQSSEAGWRPWLPLPDQALSCVDLPARDLPLRLFTPEGVTELDIPRGLLARLRLRARLTWRFAEFAHARNWQEGAQHSADHYARLLTAEGFTLRFRPYPGEPADPAVLRFFPAGLALGADGDALWERFQNYFFSVYGNSLFELTLFLGAALAAFTARHQLANLRQRRARARLPLVVGGWGTRGKSGTERIKAALFSSLGYGVVSKTTGCEAMFLHGHPHQPLREMFLFRPYDKATIWEQHDVVRIAAELQADVFLWECMALTPSFVQLLQRRWMRDDLSTITNTFPDHEDLQGPAGINIPEVMTNFIPAGGRMLTSEEQMRPILADAAARLATPLDGVGWLESGLLAPDVLARFPYQEHPDNIALVVRLAAELEIAPDYALKEMADHVVPDLGVLKVYPEAEVDGRRLSFANGMSANERFGCLGNWTRLGFDRIDMDREPGTLITAVVNNRADRIARSRVFASVVVNDLCADRFVLIGSNLEGLEGYIREAWAEHAAGLSLWPESGEDPATVLERQAQRQRVPYTPARVQARLAAMLAPQGLDDEALAGALADWNRPDALAAALAARQSAHAEEILACVRADLAQLADYEAFATRARAANTPDPALDADFRALLGAWFMRKIHTVSDYYASGNRVVQILAQLTPPGFHNRVMGIQNIKGTGLDFVYRWQAWAQCHAACANLRAPDATRFRRGLAALGAFQEYGVLCERHVRDTLALARHAPHAQFAIVQAQLTQIEANLDYTMRAVQTQLAARREQGLMERLVLACEGFFDAGDAVRRRRVANRIYRDLIAQRISHSRAAIELLALTQQQKGGWLYPRIEGRLRALQAWLAQLAGTLRPRARRPARVARAAEPTQVLHNS